MSALEAIGQRATALANQAETIQRLVDAGIIEREALKARIQQLLAEKFAAIKSEAAALKQRDQLKTQDDKLWVNFYNQQARLTDCIALLKSRKIPVPPKRIVDKTK